MKSLWGQGNSYLRVKRKNIDVSPNFARLVVIGVLIIIAVIFIAGDVGLWNLWRAQKAIKTLESDIALLQDETAYLRIRIKELETDPFALEKVAREKYGYLRPGDRVYRIITLHSDEERYKIIPTSLDNKGATE